MLTPNWKSMSLVFQEAEQPLVVLHERAQVGSLGRCPAVGVEVAVVGDADCFQIVFPLEFRTGNWALWP